MWSPFKETKVQKNKRHSRTAVFFGQKGVEMIEQT